LSPSRAAATDSNNYSSAPHFIFHTSYFIFAQEGAHHSNPNIRQFSRPPQKSVFRIEPALSLSNGSALPAQPDPKGR
jgi:hypothetical protein